MTALLPLGTAESEANNCGPQRVSQVWAIPTNLMQCNWLGERVATVDVDRAITNVINNKEDAGWGPNAVFRFPTSGGTGAIWKGVAKLLPTERQARALNAMCLISQARGGGAL